MIKTVNLLCNDSVKPMGVDNTAPLFSWQAESTELDQKQTAYQICISKAEAPYDTVGNSEKICSDQCIGIPIRRSSAYPKDRISLEGKAMGQKRKRG